MNQQTDKTTAPYYRAASKQLIGACFDNQMQKLFCYTKAGKIARVLLKTKRTNVKSFIAAAKKYTDLKELDATVLWEFIEKIYISEMDKQTKTREIRTVYNFVGAFDFDAAIKQSNNPPNVVKAGIA